MKLSVIIPVYNVEQYLPECLESVLNQDLDENLYEVIIIDDGSPDNSREIAEAYQDRYSNIKIIIRQNGGISKARNAGIRAATGEYIVMLDSDDFYSKKFFKEIFNLIDKHNHPDIVLFDFNYFYMHDNIHERVNRPYTPHDFEDLSGMEALEMILNKELMYTWYAWPFFVKLSLIKEHQLYFKQNKNYEDMMWTPVVFSLANKIIYYNHAVLEYRKQNQGQITGTVSYKNVVDPIYAPSIVKELLDINNVNLKESTYNKLMRNISYKYFTAYAFGSLLTKSERRSLIEVLKSHQHLRKYTSVKLTKVINILISIIGVKNTINLFNYILPAYRRFKKK